MNEYMRMADRMYDLENQMKQLEKENAELKKQLEMSNKVYNDNLDYSHHIEEQLTKAKEILADIIKFQPYINRDTMFLTVGNDWKEVVYKAEQFLSEVEK